MTMTMRVTALGMTIDFPVPELKSSALVKDLTLDDPKSRPAAKHVIERSPFFAILNDVCMRDSRVCLLCEMMGDDSKKDADAGIECSEGHFHCSSPRENIRL
jgi:hypothetical protein